MQKVKHYVDEMFRNLPKSKRAKELKEEILLNVDARYQELSEQNIDRAKIENQIISEIGSAEEIMENIDLTNKVKPLVVIGLELLVMLLAIGYIVHVKINEQIYSSTFETTPIVIAAIVASPLAVFFATVLVLKALTHLISPKKLCIIKHVRVGSLVAGTTLLLFYLYYLLYTLSSLNPYFMMPSVLTHFVLNNINILAGITGILLYFGTKKQIG